MVQDPFTSPKSVGLKTRTKDPTTLCANVLLGPGNAPPAAIPPTMQFGSTPSTIGHAPGVNVLTRLYE